MTEPGFLLRAKLIPPRPDRGHLRRERLHDRLDAALDGRVTFVLGGAGTGKTSVVAAYLQEREQACVWYRLDSSDRDLATFLQYLIHGVRQHAPDFGVTAAALLSASGTKDTIPDRLADALIRDAEELIDRRLVLVLDGAEALEGDNAVTRLLRRMVTYLPGTLHLALVGRELPEIGAHSLVSEGLGTILSPSDLLFDLDETRRLLLDLFALPLTEENILQLHERTRGWVTALRYLQGAPTTDGDDVLRFSANKTEAEVFSYLGEQVFAGESTEVREFLLRTSLLTTLDPEVIASAFDIPEAPTILARISERNLFVSALQGQENLYAYDPLFRDFLLGMFLRQHGRAEVDAAHAALGRAIMNRQDPSAALHHFMEANSIDDLTDLLRQHGRRMLQAGLLPRVREAALVVSKSRSSAVVEDLLGETRRLAGDYAAAAGHFQRALEAPPDPSEALEPADRAATLQGLAYSLLKLDQTEEAEAAAREGLDLAEGDPALAARILNTLSILRYRESRNQEAIQGWNEALSHARQAGDEQLTLMIAHNLGLPYAVTGDFRRASECFRMLTTTKNRRLGPEESAAYLNLARIATLQGDFDSAASFIKDASEIATSWRLPALRGDIHEAEGNLLRETGRFDAAAARYADARVIFTELGLTAALDSVTEEEAKLAASSGDLELADRLAFEVERRARATNDEQRIASALLARGMVHATAGDAAVAAAALEEALPTFASLEHAFPHCISYLLLGVARKRQGDSQAAARAAEQGLRIAARFDYRHAAKRILEASPELRRQVAGLPSAAKLELQSDLAGAEVSEIQVNEERVDLRVNLLGPIEVFDDRQNRIPASAWKLKRALQVFCYLGVSRHHRASKDRLVDAIWNDATLSMIKKNFHPTISFLRRALNHDRHVPRSFILHEAGAYLLNPSYRYRIDIQEFEKLVREARARAASKETSEAIDRYEKAMACYRGPLLEDQDDEWIVAPRAHYHKLFVAALGEAGDACWDAGDDARAIALYRKLVEQNPQDEEASIRLMSALGDRGHVGEVEEEFDRLRRALERLSLAPSPETRSVYNETLGRGANSGAAE